MIHSVLKSNITKYITIKDKDLEFFCNKMHPFHLKKKEHLLNAGEFCNKLTFVEKGCMRSFFFDQDGKEHNIQFAFEQHWIGDMYSFISGKPAIYTIEALEDCNLLSINRDELEEVYEKVPVLERFFRILIQNSYVVLQQRIISNLSENAEEKYLSLMEKNPGIFNRIPQQYIASYLGLTPESLSRIKKKLLKK